MLASDIRAPPVWGRAHESELEVAPVVRAHTLRKLKSGIPIPHNSIEPQGLSPSSLIFSFPWWPQLVIASLKAHDEPEKEKKISNCAITPPEPQSPCVRRREGVWQMLATCPTAIPLPGPPLHVFFLLTRISVLVRNRVTYVSQKAGPWNLVFQGKTLIGLNEGFSSLAAH